MISASVIAKLTKTIVKCIRIIELLVRLLSASSSSSTSCLLAQGL